MIDLHQSFREWVRTIKRQPLREPSLAAAQDALLDKAIMLLDSRQYDAGVAAELATWALVQEQHRTQYPSMVEAFRDAADALTPPDVRERAKQELADQAQELDMGY